MHLPTIVAIFVITIVGVQSMSDEMKEKLKGVVTKCIKDTGVDPKIIEAARKKNFSDDPKLKTYYRCVSETLEYLKPDGTWDINKMIDSFPPEDKDKLGALSKECCTPANGRSLEVTAFDATKCFITKYDKQVEV